MMFHVMRSWYKYGREGDEVMITDKYYDTVEKALAYAERYAKGIRFVMVQIETDDDNMELIYEYLADGGRCTVDKTAKYKTVAESQEKPAEQEEQNTTLVNIKYNDCYTNSLVIAEGTGNQHHAVQQIINKYKEEIEVFGKIRFMNIKSLKSNCKSKSSDNYYFTHLKCGNKMETRGRKTKIYLLNEQQATLLLTLLGNTKEIVKFKVALVKEFYKMKALLLEQQTPEYKEERLKGKKVRFNFVEAVKIFVEYAKSQGSTHAESYYMLFTKAINKKLNISNRALCNLDEIEELERIEKTIGIFLLNQIKKSIGYKEAFTSCKKLLDVI